MDGRKFFSLSRRGRKFLLIFVGILLGLYLIGYLVMYWFLISGSGQEWIGKQLASRGVKAEWEGAAVSPFLQPSLLNVAVEIAPKEGEARRLSAGKMVLKWSMLGEGEVGLRELHSLSGLSEGLKIAAAAIDVGWKRTDAGRRVAIEIDEPDIAIQGGAAEQPEGPAREINPDDLRRILTVAEDLCMNVLGDLEISDGKFHAAVGGGEIRIEDISIRRDMKAERLHLVGTAKSSDGTKVELETRTQGFSSQDKGASFTLLTDGFGWLPGSFMPKWIPANLQSGVSCLATCPPTGPLDVLLRLGKPEAAQTPPGSISMQIASLSPFSAQTAINLNQIAFSSGQNTPPLRIASASGQVNIPVTQTGDISMNVFLDPFEYSRPGFHIKTRTGQLDLRSTIHPRTGIQKGTLKFSAEVDSLEAGERTLDVPRLSLSIGQITSAGWKAFTADRITFDAPGFCQIDGNLSGAVSPSLEIDGNLQSRKLPLDRLWNLAIPNAAAKDTPSGMADLEAKFSVQPAEKRLNLLVAIANLVVPSATSSASEVHINNQVFLRQEGSLAGSVSISAKQPKWEDFTVPEWDFSAQITRPNNTAPIEISDIQSSCNLFTLTGTAVANTDSKGVQSITYDLVLHLEDLAEFYSSAKQIWKNLKLEGLDFGGKADIQVRGEWIRERDWKASAQATLSESRLLAESREIPVQWENLNATLKVDAQSDSQGTIRAQTQTTLSDFAALLPSGLYLDAAGKRFDVSSDLEWIRKEGSTRFRSVDVMCPGGLAVHGEGSWTSNSRQLEATLTGSDLNAIYRELLQGLLAAKWPDAVSLNVDGSARIEFAMAQDLEGVKSEGTLHATLNTAEMGNEIALQGISADLAAGLDAPGSSEPRLQARGPMRLSANRIQWGSETVEDLVLQPLIVDGDIEWKEPISLSLQGGNAKIGPVRITQPLSSHSLTQTSVQFHRKESVAESDNSDLLNKPSEVEARLSEVTISGDVLAATGDMQMGIFGGHAVISDIRVLQVFSSYPIWGGDISFERLDLAQVCDWLELGRIEGTVSGSVRDLQLLLGENIKPVSFDLDVESDPGTGTISREALKMIFDMGQQASTRILMDRSEYSYGRLGLRAKLDQDRFFLWGKFQDGEMYYFLEPPTLVERIFPPVFHTVRIALNAPDRELSFQDVWTRLRSQSFESPDIRISFLQKANPLKRLYPF
ncbi:MAG TPA: hypothetical protein PLY86_08815 [bacterium]|nr:hypothetical protein [bacterium]